MINLLPILVAIALIGLVLMLVLGAVGVELGYLPCVGIAFVANWALRTLGGAAS